MRVKETSAVITTTFPPVVAPVAEEAKLKLCAKAAPAAACTQAKVFYA